jgi:hypothetical protein
MADPKYLGQVVVLLGPAQAVLGSGRSFLLRRADRANGHWDLPSCGRRDLPADGYEVCPLAAIRRAQRQAKDSIPLL